MASWPLEATLVDDDRRVPIAIVRDSTRGLLQTGMLLLDLDAVDDSPGLFTIELRAPRGFARPPRLLRLEPNVVPIVQGRTITSERQIATGFPDWTFELSVPGLRFDEGEEPLRSLYVGEPDGLVKVIAEKDPTTFLHAIARARITSPPPRRRSAC